MQKSIDEWIINSPQAPPFSVVLEDKAELKEPRVFLRGNPANKGKEVPRQFLKVLAPEERQPYQQGSGRRELANEIASRENPLTARVLVNRVWMHHFGAGLVTTPSDFGTRASTPSHPELLDWLSCYFMDDGWSIKKLHRMMLLSATYQQASENPAMQSPARLAVDPENSLLWRYTPHRLDFEALRDALLMASGELDLRLGGRGTPLFQEPYSTRRTLYGYVDRQFLPGVYRVFDYPNPDLHNPQRVDTTVPQQALFLMNNGFVQERARALAKRLAETKEDARVQQLYAVAYQRPPQPEEQARALQFLQHARDNAPAPPPPPKPTAWQYGYGYVDETTKQTVFTALPHFNGTAWQGGVAWPDIALGWVQLTATGGHVGNDAKHAAIRRWTAPVNGAIAIAGTLKYPRTEGDGVRASLVSSRHGLLGQWPVNKNTAETALANVEVQQGDTLDFIVETWGSLSFDEFLWAPKLDLAVEAGLAAAGDTPAAWKAEEEFGGPVEAAALPLSEWEKLAQVILLSNEFHFVQ